MDTLVAGRTPEPIPDAVLVAPDVPPMLEIRHLVKRFGGLTAVDDVSLEVRAGEVVGLVGDNGAGKSTLIKCVSGVHQGEEGGVPNRGRPGAVREAHRRPQCGDRDHLPGPRACGQPRRVRQHLPGSRGQRKRLIPGVATLDEKRMLAESRTVLDSLDIRIPRFRAEIDDLSGGQRQAVAIARAVYWKARLMIMDEPTNNLGVPEQRKVLGLIGTLKKQRVPVVLISHTLPDVFDVTDRIIVMHRGRKVADKPTASTNSTEIVEYMVGARNDFPGADA